MDKQLFNKVYAKYSKKDYFGNKAIIKSKIAYAKQYNQNIGKEQIVIRISDIKAFLKNEKEKAYNFMLKRIEERKQGKHFPLREKFSHEIFKILAI